MSRPIFKRQQIHEAAMKLFVEKGIEGTTTREIAEAAKAGEGTMFRHYKSKEDLAWHLFDENLSRFVKELEDVVQKEAATRQKLGTLIAKCYELFETDRTLASYLLLSEHTAARRMPADYKTPFTILLGLVEQGQGRGELRPMDPVVAASLVFGAVLRVPLSKIYGRVQRDLRELADEVTGACWKMIA